MIKDKINCLQFAAMMSVILIASFVGIGMFSIIKSAGVDAYLSIIIAGIIGIFIVLTFFNTFYNYYYQIVIFFMIYIVFLLILFYYITVVLIYLIFTHNASYHW